MSERLVVAGIMVTGRNTVWLPTRVNSDDLVRRLPRKISRPTLQLLAGQRRMLIVPDTQKYSRYRWLASSRLL